LKLKGEELEVQKKQSVKELRRNCTNAEKELGLLRSELKLKGEELGRQGMEAVRAKINFDQLRMERDDLVQVRNCPFVFHNVICVLMYLFLLLLHDSVRNS
jgi:hypothetical protein